MPLPRASLALLASPALVLAFALAQPAHADIRPDAPASATARHHGVAFAAPKGAQARIVEPDGRIVNTDGVSDLVAPASIASRQAHSAIARLISAEAVDKSAEVQSLPEAAASDAADAPKTAPRRETNHGLKFGAVIPGI